MKFAAVCLITENEITFFDRGRNTRSGQAHSFLSVVIRDKKPKNSSKRVVLEVVEISATDNPDANLEINQFTITIQMRPYIKKWSDVIDKSKALGLELTRENLERIFKTHMFG